MFKGLRKLAIVTTLGSAGIVALGLPAYAQNNVNASETSSVSEQAQKKWLDMRDILSRVESAGYTDISEVEKESSDVRRHILLQFLKPKGNIFKGSA